MSEKSQIPTKDLINGGVKIFSVGIQMSKGGDEQKNVGEILSTAGGIAMAFGGPMGFVAGGILCGSGALLIASSPTKPSEVAQLKQSMEKMVQGLSYQIQQNHIEQMQKLNIIEQTVYIGFQQTKKSLIQIQDNCQEILAHQLKDWNTKQLHNFEAHFKTFIEKRHVFGDEQALEYINKIDPMYFKNMLDPQNLKKWVSDLKSQNQRDGLVYMAIQDFMRYRWMTFLLILYQSLKSESSTNIDPVIYCCESLKEDMIEYYLLYDKYINFTNPFQLIGLDQKQQVISYQNKYNFDTMIYFYENGKDINQYKISQVEVTFCHWESIRSYNILKLKITYSHIAYDDTMIQEVGYGQCGCGKKQEKYVINLKNDEYITKIDLPLRFGIETSREQRILDPQNNNKYVFIDQEISGFQFLQQDHIVINRFYTRKDNPSSFEKTAKGQLQMIEFDNDRLKKDDWNYFNFLKNSFINAQTQEFYTSLKFNLQYQYIDYWKAYFIARTINNATSNYSFKSLAINMSEREYDIKYQKQMFDNFSANDNLESLEIETHTRFDCNDILNLLGRLNSLYPNLKDLRLEYSSNQKKFNEKQLEILSQNIGNLQQNFNQIYMTLSLDNISQEKFDNFLRAIGKLKVQFVTMRIGISNTQMKQEDQTKQKFQSMCPNVQQYLNLNVKIL